MGIPQEMIAAFAAVGAEVQTEQKTYGSALKKAEETFKVSNGKLVAVINGNEIQVEVPTSLFIKDVAVHSATGEKVHCPRGQKFEYLAGGVLKKVFTKERARERNALVRFLLQISEEVQRQGSVRQNTYVETVYGLKYMEWSGLKTEPKEALDDLKW